MSVIHHPFKMVGLITVICIFVSGCGGHNGFLSSTSLSTLTALDTDDDGIMDSLDCAPNDSLKSQKLGYISVDLDLDNRFVASNGQICSGKSLPAGYSNLLLAGQPDCNDNDQAISNESSFYVDKDLDGYGGSETKILCAVSPPEGFSISGGDPNDEAHDVIPDDRDGDKTSNEMDCAPDDGTRFISALVRPDADDDGYWSGAETEVCIGVLPPPGYIKSSVAIGEDCNDSNQALFVLRDLYLDKDADGYGGVKSQNVCTNFNLVPAGFSGNNEDCNDSDSALFKALIGYKDEDGDTFGVMGQGERFCAASLPNGWVAESFDRDDTNSSINIRTVTLKHYAPYPGGERVNIEIKYNAEPINLDLAAYDKTEWSITGRTSRLRSVIIRGYETQRVTAVLSGLDRHSWRDNLSQQNVRISA